MQRCCSDHGGMMEESYAREGALTKRKASSRKQAFVGRGLYIQPCPAVTPDLGDVVSGFHAQNLYTQNKTV